MLLGWLLNPREGHHQHDYFIRQLLSAYIRNLPDDFPLDHSFKLLNRSYSDAQVITEFVLPSKKRIDIVIIDRNSKTLIVIERKDGTKAHSEQLSVYREWVQMHFSDWTQIFILSDSHEHEHGEEFDKHYVQLNDEWLISAVKEILSLPDVSKEVQINLKNALRLIDDDFEYPIEKKWFELGKKLSQKHSLLLKELKSKTINVGSRSYPFLDINPNVYLKLISNKSQLLTDPLLSALQDNYYELYDLSSFSEFEHFEDNVRVIAPSHIDLSLEYGKDKVSFTHKSHAITEEDFWPYFLTLSCNNESHGTFDLTLHLNKKANEKALCFVDAMANAYEFKPSRKKVYFERVLLSQNDDISLNRGTALRREVDRFFEWVKKIDR